MTTLKGKHVLMVVAPESFRDEELLEPKKVLESAGARVSVASTRKGKAKGMLGAVVDIDCELSGLKAGDYDAIVVVGGMGSPTHLWNEKRLHRLLHDGKKLGRTVAGICLSGAVLANAGVLNGIEATVYRTKESEAALEAGGATRIDKDLVVAGRVITANGPEVATRFGEAIAKALRS